MRLSSDWVIGLRVEYSPMVRQTVVQSQLESYLKLKNGTRCRLALHSVLKGKDQG